jgi:hypothetical protein
MSPAHIRGRMLTLNQLLIVIGLQALAAGQKIMVRIGTGREQRLKAVLRRLRAELVGAETTRR